MKCLHDDFFSELQSITELSAQKNGKLHSEKLLEMISSHSEEISELYFAKNPHFAVETADLLILCLELLIEEGKDIDETIALALPRFYNKLQIPTEDVL